MQQGRDVLIYLDELTHHARAYRELSLIVAVAPPGRERFPGDIFLYSIHGLAGTHHPFTPGARGGSITALTDCLKPKRKIIFRLHSTNLISITERAKIYLSPCCLNWAVARY